MKLAEKGFITLAFDASHHGASEGQPRFIEIPTERVEDIIECLKNCGLKIKEIKKFIDWTLAGDSTIDERLNFFQEKLSEIQNKISQMNETLDAIRYKVWFYQTARDARTIEIHDTMKPEEVPEEMKEIRSRMKHVERVANRNFWKK